MRVLFVTNHRDARNLNPSAGIFIERQAESLRSTGVEVHFFDLGRSHSPITLAKRWLALRHEIRRLRPHLVHAQYGTIVSFVSALTFHPLVITFHGSDLLVGASVSLPRTYMGIFLSNVAALFARRIICVSEQLRQSLWWRSDAALVIPCGVDLTAFSPGSRDEARAHLGWDLGKYVVLMDGARDPKNKGLELVEEAIMLARKVSPEVELRIVQGVQPDEMPWLFRAADVLVCASRQEGSPSVVKEALACALPVVSVDVGDVVERLRGVDPSLIVERNPIAIAEGILDVLKHRRRSNGPEVVKPLSIQRIASRIVGVYRSALPQHSGRSETAA
jgi:teichuronic acid biosynthesis glycosyltransferase TuaC